jgi:hypothetical protein
VQERSDWRNIEHLHDRHYLRCIFSFSHFIVPWFNCFLLCNFYYQWLRGPLSLVSTTEELLVRKVAAPV